MSKMTKTPQYITFRMILKRENKQVFTLQKFIFEFEEYYEITDFKQLIDQNSHCLTFQSTTRLLNCCFHIRHDSVLTYKNSQRFLCTVAHHAECWRSAALWKTAPRWCPAPCRFPLGCMAQDATPRPPEPASPPGRPAAPSEPAPAS